MSVRFGASDAIGFAWLRFKEQPGALIGALILVSAAVMVPMLAYVILLSMEYTAIAFLFYVVGILLSLFMAVGMFAISIKVADRKPWAFSEFFAHANRFFPYLGAMILYALVTTGGLFLFVLPGIYWGTRFSFYPYFAIEKNQGPVEALKSSWALTEGSFWDLIGVRTVSAIVTMLSMIPFGIGLLITIPMRGIVEAYVFRQLENHPFVPQS